MDVGLNNKNTLGEIAPEFSDVVFFVEANSNEQFLLWQEYSKESMSNIQPLSDAAINNIPTDYREDVKILNNKVKKFAHTRIDWKQIMSGFGLTIGQVQRKPVCVTFNFAIINGKKVCFYYPSSIMVDHRMIENWLISRFQLTHDKYTRWNHVDANNFHNCVNSLDNIDKEPRETVYKSTLK